MSTSPRSNTLEAVTQKNKLGSGQSKIAPSKPRTNFIFTQPEHPVYTTTKLNTSKLNPIFTKSVTDNSGLKAMIVILVLILIGGGITIGVLYDQGYIRFGKNEIWTY